MWITNEREAPWEGMELSACQSLSLESLPFLTEKSWKGLTLANDWIGGAMKIWSAVKQNMSLSGSICRDAKIEFLPSMKDSGCNTWANKRVDILFMERVFNVLQVFNLIYRHTAIINSDN